MTNEFYPSERAEVENKERGEHTDDPLLDVENEEPIKYDYDALPKPECDDECEACT